jgi:spore coat protein W
MANIMKGAGNLNNSNQKPGESPNKLMELMMLNILQKHGITKENVKGKVTDEQKQLIFDLLEELKQQSGSLVDRAKSTSPKTKPK